MKNKIRIARDYLFQQRNSFDPTELLRELEYALSSYYPLFFGAGQVSDLNSNKSLKYYKLIVQNSILLRRMGRHVD